MIKKIHLLLVAILILSNQSTFSQNKLSNKELLDSICNYLVISGSVQNRSYYNDSRVPRTYSNQLFEEAYGFNFGSITIDTISFSIRLNFTGTQGSGGFPPHIQQTFYFKDLTSFNWETDNNKRQLLLEIKSSYSCNRQNKPIYVFEKSSGCKGSENPLGNSTENKGSIEEIITNSCYSSYKLSFYKENFTNSKKNNLNSWLNEIKSR